MSYKIIDKKKKHAVINYSFQSWNGSKISYPAFVTTSPEDAILFSSKKDDEQTALRLGDKFKVVKV